MLVFFQLICDGARMYTDKIHIMMERSNFYDDDDEQFDITDTVCRMCHFNPIEMFKYVKKTFPKTLFSK
jgi:hypothetical protein